MKRYVIGLDIGTTSAKAVAVAQDGGVLAQASAGYALITAGRRIEQRPQDWMEASRKLLHALTNALPDALPVGLSLSTQGATTAAVDAEGTPIGNAITWMDTRSVREAGQIEAELGADYIYRRSGWRISPSLDTAKIRHMRGDPAFAKAVKYLSTMELMNAWLTGRAVIDPSNAAIRQLFDVERGCWDDRLVAAATITTQALPEVAATGSLVGGLTARAAAETGLPVGLPVFNGAHDQYCAAIGAGAVSEGDLLLSAGTTWALLGITAAPVFTRSYLSPGKHPVAGLYGAMASLSCAGASLQWFKNGFLTEEFDEINRAVADRREQTGDLFFYPYLAGANYPVWNQNARGAFTGLTLEHDRFDLARAIMEGVAFGVRRGIDDFLSNGIAVRRIRIMGGAAKSDVWCQMVADIAGMPIERLGVTDVCALGAAAIAMKGSGLCASYPEAADRMAKPGRTFAPDSRETSYFREKYGRYQRMERGILGDTAGDTDDL